MTLNEFAKQYPKAVLAFSGGSDSAFLLYMSRVLEVEWIPVFVKSEFQPQFELDDAKRLSEELQLSLTILRPQLLSDPDISRNGNDRCYFCKKQIMNTIRDWSSSNGYGVILDGTNASDSYEGRPGMKVLEEFHILSPLRICGLTKTDVRRRSKEIGLFTWEKPSYACLATRIRENEPIDQATLEKIESVEEYLKRLGFIDFRVRVSGNSAVLQITENQFHLLFANRNLIFKELQALFSDVLLDLKSRQQETMPGGDKDDKPGTERTPTAI